MQGLAPQLLRGCVRVEAAGICYHDLLGQAVTDADGAFTVAFDSDYFRSFDPERAPDVFFRLYRDDVEILSTAPKPLRNLQRGTSSVVGGMETPAAAPAPSAPANPTATPAPATSAPAAPAGNKTP